MRASAPKEQVINTPDANAPPARAAVRLRMSLEVALDLALCGGLAAGLSFLAQYQQPDFSRATLFTGLVGGGLCVLWAVLGRRGTRCRGGAMVTLAAIACMFVRQAVHSWEASAEGESKGRMVAALMTMLVVFCVGMLANLVREGKDPQP
jgi:peptidoglycan/LPS O-acetylase OafA/YrhL